MSKSNARTRNTPAQADAEQLALRVRAAIGSALGIAQDAPLTHEALAVAVERVCARVAETPGAALLARDLTEG